MSDDTDTDDGSDEQVVINSHRAWGKDDNRADALRLMLTHWGHEFQDAEILHVVRYTGTLEKLSLFGHVQVDGEILEAEAIEVDGDQLEELAKLEKDAASLAHAVFEDAEEVDPDEDGDEQ